ncbi:hypothetical protein RR46_00825 [Papilio xuthus]|uniref:Uncharacterized protein n=1 Tax=Papilio xuthus TaxID=66420 RepID=A0A0N0PAE0_PAPXU|nr:hypothetical protein RR46_00825 [Papilio xuthus]
MPKDCRHYKPPQDGQDGLASYWEHRHIHNEYGLWQIRATNEDMRLYGRGTTRLSGASCRLLCQCACLSPRLESASAVLMWEVSSSILNLN